jgi:hypothetical protein
MRSEICDSWKHPRSRCYNADTSDCLTRPPCMGLSGCAMGTVPHAETLTAAFTKAELVAWWSLHPPRACLVACLCKHGPQPQATGQGKEAQGQQYHQVVPLHCGLQAPRGQQQGASHVRAQCTRMLQPCAGFQRHRIQVSGAWAPSPPAPCTG